MIMCDSKNQMSPKEHAENISIDSIKITIKYRKIGEFITRESLLTDLFQISHINCIRNAFIAGFILMILRQIINDFIYYGKLNWTFELLFLTVNKLHIVAIIWFLMFLFTSIIIFSSTYIWAINRRFARVNLKFYDTICLWIYISYIVSLLVIPCWQIIKYQLPLVSSAIILAEQLRQLMKIHSFVRENIRKIHHQQFNISIDLSKFSIEFSYFNQYFYFLFAPTLIYRDIYPRTSKIRWSIVWKMFGQFLIIIFLLYDLIAYFWMPIFQRFFMNNDITLELSVSAIFDLMIPGVLIIILAFYGFFHCWLNGFAELLCFADRMFYEDWWNLTSAATFWRTWNVVVHDWLYVYIYKDLNKLFNGNRKMSISCVVILSAIFHEYFMIVILGFFSPILITWFGLFGILFRFAFPHAKGTQWNILLLTFVPISAGLIPYLYVLEASARYFPLKRKTFWNMMLFNDNKQSKYEL